MAGSEDEFIPLSALRAPRPASEILAEIRRLYFTTRRDTIHADMAHAIALLKSLPTEEDRERSTVYMEGLARMRSDWAVRSAKTPKPSRPSKTRKASKTRPRKSR